MRPNYVPVAVGWGIPAGAGHVASDVIWRAQVTEPPRAPRTRPSGRRRTVIRNVIRTAARARIRNVIRTAARSTRANRPAASPGHPRRRVRQRAAHSPECRRHPYGRFRGKKAGTV
ncbi:hypothetical protein GCM10027091_11850 [Streptomyces daliensis]